jgi:methionyl-tRNA formyltransferase
MDLGVKLSYFLEMIEKEPFQQLFKQIAHIKTAYKLNKENCKIDWTKPAVEINNLIRGLSPYPSCVLFKIKRRMEC